MQVRREPEMMAGVPVAYLLLLAPALFAANMVAARWAQGVGIPPLFLAFGRWLLAFSLLLPFVIGPLRAARQQLFAAAPQLFLLGALGMGMAVAPQYVGAQSTSATNIALIFAASPVLVALLESVGWGVRVPAQRLFGLLVALLGVLLILSRGDLALLRSLSFGQGDLWVLFAASGWSMYSVLLKRKPLPPLNSSVRLAILMLGGILALAPFAAIEAAQGRVADFGQPEVYAALLFLALVPSLGAYFVYDRLISRVGSAGASASMYLVPVYVALLAWPLLGELPQTHHLLGVALVLPGVALANLGSDRRGFALFGFNGRMQEAGSVANAGFWTDFHDGLVSLYARLNVPVGERMRA